jgi:hypothetical protein
MTYIPVGTRLTYTAQVSNSIISFHGFNNWETLSNQLKQDLPNLQGMEELDVESASGNNPINLSGNFSVSLAILNNGVDHGDEHDIQSIIDGTIQGYGNQLLSSSITQIKLPNNPDDGTLQVINTGAPSNVPPPSQSNSSIFSGFSLSGGSIAGISITLIVIVLIIAVLLLPGNARRLVGG